MRIRGGCYAHQRRIAKIKVDKTKVLCCDETEEKEKKSEAEAKHHAARGHKAKAHSSRGAGKAVRLESH